MIAYVNHSFIEEEKAMLHVSDLALLRGYAAFDYLRTRNHQPLFLDDYLDRFFHSAEQLHLQPMHTRKELRDIILELANRNKLPESGIRMIMTGGYSPDSYEPAKANLVVLQQNLVLPSAEKFQAGVKVITHPYQRDLPLVKSINYLMGIWLQKKIREENASDVLYHSNGMITEFPRANVFMVTKENKIVTPRDNILKGITRMKVLELLRGKYEVEERGIQMDEVRNAAEVFMTSTTKRILPVCQVDDVMIGEGRAGAVTTVLNQLFMEMEEEIGRRV